MFISRRLVQKVILALVYSAVLIIWFIVGFNLFSYLFTQGFIGGFVAASFLWVFLFNLRIKH